MLVLNSLHVVLQSEFLEARSQELKLVERFKVGKNAFRYGQSSFSTKAFIEFYMDEYYSEIKLKKAINKIKYTGIIFICLLII